MVMTLWLIIVLMVMAYSLSYEMRLGLKSTSMAQKRMKALGLARMGIARAVMDLRNDRLLAVSSSALNDTLDDIWTSDDDEHMDVKVGEGSYSVVVRDEERKIDLNVMKAGTEPVLASLLNDLYKIRDEDAKKMAQAVIDYRDTDNKPLIGTGETETEAYTDWGFDFAGKTLPEGWLFRPKNEDFRRLEELLLIPGFTREMLHGDPAEESRDPFEREKERRREPSYALEDYVTVMSSGRLNINTAGEEVLTAVLCGINVPPGEAPGLAKKVIEARHGRERVKQNGVSGYMDESQLADAGFSAGMIQAIGAITPLGVVSQVFVITARGEYQGVRQTVQARVGVGIETFQTNSSKERRYGTRDDRGVGLLKNKPDLRVDPSVRVQWLNTPTE
jgi:type II secretory pathway component PulK